VLHHVKCSFLSVPDLPGYTALEGSSFGACEERRVPGAGRQLVRRGCGCILVLATQVQHVNSSLSCTGRTATSPGCAGMPPGNVLEAARVVSAAVVVALACFPQAVPVLHPRRHRQGQHTQGTACRSMAQHVVACHGMGQ